MFGASILIIILFTVYLYFQSKVKNGSNYPMVYAIMIAMLVYASSSSVPQWIIDNVNRLFQSLHLSAYTPTSHGDMITFWVVLMVLMGIFYWRKREISGESGTKTSFMSWVNFGTINQTNHPSGDATKKRQEEIKEKLDRLMSYSQNSGLSNTEKQQLQDKILSLQREIVALSVDDGVIDSAETLIREDKEGGIQRALALMEKSNTKTKIAKQKEQNKKQASILRYQATLYVQTKQWSKAETYYRDATEFEASNENYLAFAYFLQTYTANREEIVKYYNLVLSNTTNLTTKSLILNNLANFYADDNTKRTQAETYYQEALDNYRALAKENRDVYGLNYANTLVMGVDLFGDSVDGLDEALDYLEPYDDSYANVGWLRHAVARLKSKDTQP